MPSPFPLLSPASDVDEVVAQIESVIAWSIENGSRLGYFAALYKRITRAVGVAIEAGLFENGARMVHLDATFANRYLAALNGYFHPALYPAPTQAWRVAFGAAELSGPIVVQHMLAGVNAHINLDLGIAAFETMAPNAVAPLHADFDTINLVLGEQVEAVLAEINAISPVLADIYALLRNDEIALIDDGLVAFRDSAWDVATELSAAPGSFDALVAARDATTAALGTLIADPQWPFASIVAAIAAAESRDVAHNVRVLDGIASEAVAVSATVSVVVPGGSAGTLEVVSETVTAVSPDTATVSAPEEASDR